MSQNLPFTKCLHPVEVKTLRGIQLVKCGKCEACENSKRSELRAKVQFEETNSKHTFFLTLTYSDEYLPIFRLVKDDSVSCIDSFGGNFYYSSVESSPLPVYSSCGKLIRGATQTFQNDKLTPVRYALIPNQSRIQTDNYSKRLNSWAFNIDTELYTRCIGFDYDPSVSLGLKEYHHRLNANVRKCVQLGIRNNTLSWYSQTLDPYNSVPLLYYPDIQRFIKRLRKLISTKFGKNEKIRYYIIGEYGTSSFRPHWHVLLFINSDSISEWLLHSFTENRVLSTTQRTIHSSSILSTLWKFGVSTIDKTDGNASGYVSNYVVGSSVLPQILTQLMPQKTFHSVRFGCPYSEKQVSQFLHQRDFEQFSKIEFVDNSSTLQSRPLWRSYYSLFFPQFTGVNSLSDDEKYRVLTIFPKLASYFFETTISKLARIIYFRCILPSHQSYEKDQRNETEKQIASFFDWFQWCPSTKLSLSPLENVLYASKRFLQFSQRLGFSSRAYFDVWRDFINWRDSRQLRQHYYDCHINEVYRDVYYSIYGSGKIDLDYLNNSVLYKVFCLDSIRQNRKLVKHKALVEQLKNI